MANYNFSNKDLMGFLSDAYEASVAANKKKKISEEEKQKQAKTYLQQREWLRSKQLSLEQEAKVYDNIAKIYNYYPTNVDIKQNVVKDTEEAAKNVARARVKAEQAQKSGEREAEKYFKNITTGIGVTGAKRFEKAPEAVPGRVGVGSAAKLRTKLDAAVKKGEAQNIRMSSTGKSESADLEDIIRQAQQMSRVYYDLETLGEMGSEKQSATQLAMRYNDKEYNAFIKMNKIMAKDYRKKINKAQKISTLSDSAVKKLGKDELLSEDDMRDLLNLADIRGGINQKGMPTITATHRTWKTNPKITKKLLQEMEAGYQLLTNETVYDNRVDTLPEGWEAGIKKMAVPSNYGIAGQNIGGFDNRHLRKEGVKLPKDALKNFYDTLETFKSLHKVGDVSPYTQEFLTGYKLESIAKWYGDELTKRLPTGKNVGKTTWHVGSEDAAITQAVGEMMLEETKGLIGKGVLSRGEEITKGSVGYAGAAYFRKPNDRSFSSTGTKLNNKNGWDDLLVKNGGLYKFLGNVENEDKTHTLMLQDLETEATKYIEFESERAAQAFMGRTFSDGMNADSDESIDQIKNNVFRKGSGFANLEALVKRYDFHTLGVGNEADLKVSSLQQGRYNVLSEADGGKDFLISLKKLYEKVNKYQLSPEAKGLVLEQIGQQIDSSVVHAFTASDIKKEVMGGYGNDGNKGVAATRKAYLDFAEKFIDENTLPVVKEAINDAASGSSDLLMRQGDDPFSGVRAWMYELLKNDANFLASDFYKTRFSNRNAYLSRPDIDNATGGVDKIAQQISKEFASSGVAAVSELYSNKYTPDAVKNAMSGGHLSSRLSKVKAGRGVIPNKWGQVGKDKQGNALFAEGTTGRLLGQAIDKLRQQGVSAQLRLNANGTGIDVGLYPTSNLSEVFNSQNPWENMTITTLPLADDSGVLSSINKVNAMILSSDRQGHTKINTAQELMAQNFYNLVDSIDENNGLSPLASAINSGNTRRASGILGSSRKKVIDDLVGDSTYGRDEIYEGVRASGSEYALSTKTSQLFTHGRLKQILENASYRKKEDITDQDILTAQQIVELMVRGGLPYVANEGPIKNMQENEAVMAALQEVANAFSANNMRPHFEGIKEISHNKGIMNLAGSHSVTPFGFLATETNRARDQARNTAPKGSSVTGAQTKPGVFITDIGKQIQPFLDTLNEQLYYFGAITDSEIYKEFTKKDASGAYVNPKYSPYRSYSVDEGGALVSKTTAQSLGAFRSEKYKFKTADLRRLFQSQYGIDVNKLNMGELSQFFANGIPGHQVTGHAFNIGRKDDKNIMAKPGDFLTGIRKISENEVEVYLERYLESDFAQKMLSQYGLKLTPQILSDEAYNYIAGQTNNTGADVLVNKNKVGIKSAPEMIGGRYAYLISNYLQKNGQSADSVKKINEAIKKTPVLKDLLTYEENNGLPNWVQSTDTNNVMKDLLENKDKAKLFYNEDVKGSYLSSFGKELYGDEYKNLPRLTAQTFNMFNDYPYNRSTGSLLPDEMHGAKGVRVASKEKNSLARSITWGAISSGETRGEYSELEETLNDYVKDFSKEYKEKVKLRDNINKNLEIAKQVNADGEDLDSLIQKAGMEIIRIVNKPEEELLKNEISLSSLGNRVSYAKGGAGIAPEDYALTTTGILQQKAKALKYKNPTAVLDLGAEGGIDSVGGLAGNRYSQIPIPMLPHNKIGDNIAPPESSRELDNLLRAVQDNDPEMSATAFDTYYTTLANYANNADSALVENLLKTSVTNASSPKMMGGNAVQALEENLTNTLFVSPDTLKELLTASPGNKKTYKKNLAQNVKRLQLILNKINNGGDSFEPLVDTNDMPRQEADLINRIIEAIDINGTQGTDAKTLLANYFRYPSITGKDVTFSRLGVDSTITKKGVMRTYSGLNEKTKTDFDGDVGRLMLFFMKAKADNAKKFNKVWDQAENITKLEDESTQLFATQLKQQEDYDNSITTEASEQFEHSLSPETDAAASVYSKTAFGKVGMFSNVASSMRLMSTNFGMDELGVGNKDPKQKRLQVAKAAILRAFAGVPEQDSISAKKVIKRLDVSGDEEAKQIFLDELDNLYQMMRGGKQEGLSKAEATTKWTDIIRKMKEIGLLSTGKNGEAVISNAQGRGVVQDLQAAGYSAEEFSKLGLSDYLTNKDTFNPLGGAIPISAILPALIDLELKSGEVSKKSIAGNLGNPAFRYNNTTYRSMNDPIFTGGESNGLYQGLADSEALDKWRQQQEETERFSRFSLLSKAKKVGPYTLVKGNNLKAGLGLTLPTADGSSETEEYIGKWISEYGKMLNTAGAEARAEQIKSALVEAFNMKTTESGEAVPVENQLAFFDKIQENLVHGKTSDKGRGARGLMEALAGGNTPAAFADFTARINATAKEAGYVPVNFMNGKGAEYPRFSQDSQLASETEKMSTLSDVVANEHNPAYVEAIALEQKKGNVAVKNADKLGEEASAMNSVAEAAKKANLSITDLQALKIHRGKDFESNHAYYEGNEGQDDPTKQVLSVTQFRSALLEQDPIFKGRLQHLSKLQQNAIGVDPITGELTGLGSVTAEKAGMDQDSFDFITKKFMLGGARGSIAHAQVQALSQFESSTGIVLPQGEKNMEGLQKYAEYDGNDVALIKQREAAKQSLELVRAETLKYSGLLAFDGIDEKSFDVSKLVENYIGLYQKMFGENSPLAQYSEKLLGAQFKIGDQTYKVAGSIDQVAMLSGAGVPSNESGDSPMLFDNKFTTGFRGFAESMQASFYKLLMAANPDSFNATDASFVKDMPMRIMHVGEDGAEAINVADMGQQVLAYLIRQADFNIKHPDEAKYLNKEDQESLNMRVGYGDTYYKPPTPEEASSVSYLDAANSALSKENVDSIYNLNKYGTALGEYKTKTAEQEKIVGKIAKNQALLQDANEDEAIILTNNNKLLQEKLEKLEEEKKLLIENNKLKAKDIDDINATASNRVMGVVAGGLEAGSQGATKAESKSSKDYLSSTKDYFQLLTNKVRTQRELNEGGVSRDRLTALQDQLSNTEALLYKYDSGAGNAITAVKNEAGETTGYKARFLDRDTQSMREETLSIEEGTAAMAKQEDQWKRTQIAMSKASTATLKSQSLFAAVAGGLKNSLRNLIDYQLAYQIVGKIQQGVASFVQTVKSLDSALTDLAIATATSRNGMRESMSDYNTLASKIGQTTTAVASAANDWLRAGYQGQEAANLTEASMRLSVLGMEESATATTQLISVLKGWKIASEDVMGVVDKLTALDVQVATSAGGIAEAMSQANNMARLSGMSLDKYAASVAGVIDVTQMDPSRVGNAFKTMMSRYSNVKAGKFSASEADMAAEDYDASTWENLNDTETVVKTMGMSLRSDVGTFKSFEQVLDEIAGKWETLTDVEKSAIGTAMAGTRQREVFLALMENYSHVIELAEVSSNSFGSSEKKMESYTDSLTAAQNRLTASIEKVAAWEGFADILKEIYKIATAIMDSGFISILSLAGVGVASALTNSKRLSGKAIGTIGSYFMNRASARDENSADIANLYQSMKGFFSGQSQKATPKGAKDTVQYYKDKFVNGTFNQSFNAVANENTLSSFISSVDTATSRMTALGDATADASGMLVKMVGNSLFSNTNTNQDSAAFFEKALSGKSDDENVQELLMDMINGVDVQKEYDEAANNMATLVDEGVNFGDVLSQMGVTTEQYTAAQRVLNSLSEEEKAKIRALLDTLGQLDPKLKEILSTVVGATPATGTGGFGQAATGVLSMVGSIGGMTGGYAIGNAIGGSMGAVLGSAIVPALTSLIPSTIGSGIAGVLIGAIGLAINYAEKKLSDLKAKAEELTDTYKTALSADIKGEEYAKLATGVGKYGQNLSLTDDEYEKFLDLSTEMAEAFPELISYTDASGQSFVNLGKSVSESTKLMEESLDGYKTNAEKALLVTEVFRSNAQEAKKTAQVSLEDFSTFNDVNEADLVAGTDAAFLWEQQDRSTKNSRDEARSMLADTFEAILDTTTVFEGTAYKDLGTNLHNLISTYITNATDLTDISDTMKINIVQSAQTLYNLFDTTYRGTLDKFYATENTTAQQYADAQSEMLNLLMDKGLLTNGKLSIYQQDFAEAMGFGVDKNGMLETLSTLEQLQNWMQDANGGNNTTAINSFISAAGQLSEEDLRIGFKLLTDGVIAATTSVEEFYTAISKEKYKDLTTNEIADSLKTLQERYQTLQKTGNTFSTSEQNNYDGLLQMLDQYATQLGGIKGDYDDLIEKGKYLESVDIFGTSAASAEDLGNKYSTYVSLLEYLNGDFINSGKKWDTDQLATVMGDANLVAFVDDAQKLKEYLIKALQYEGDDYTNAIEHSLIASESGTQKILNDNQELVNSLEAQYGIDFNNFATLEELKGILSQATVGNVDEAYSRMVGVLENHYAADLQNYTTFAQKKQALVELLNGKMGTVLTDSETGKSITLQSLFGSSNFDTLWKQYEDEYNNYINRLMGANSQNGWLSNPAMVSGLSSGVSTLVSGATSGVDVNGAVNINSMAATYTPEQIAAQVETYKQALEQVTRSMVTDFSFLSGDGLSAFNQYGQKIIQAVAQGVEDGSIELENALEEVKARISSALDTTEQIQVAQNINKYFAEIDVDGIADTWSELADVFESIGNGYNELADAQNEYASMGKLSAKTVLDLLSKNSAYAEILTVENGKIGLVSKAQEKWGSIQQAIAAQSIDLAIAEQESRQDAILARQAEIESEKASLDAKIANYKAALTGDKAALQAVSAEIEGQNKANEGVAEGITGLNFMASAWMDVANAAMTAAYAQAEANRVASSKATTVIAPAPFSGYEASTEGWTPTPVEYNPSIPTDEEIQGKIDEMQAQRDALTTEDISLGAEYANLTKTIEIEKALKNENLEDIGKAYGSGGGGNEENLKERIELLQAIQDLLDKDIYLMNEFNSAAEGVSDAAGRMADAMGVAGLSYTGDYYKDQIQVMDALIKEYKDYYDVVLAKGADDGESQIEFGTRLLGIQKEMNDLVKERNDLDDEEVQDNEAMGDLMHANFATMYAYKMELLSTADTFQEYLEYLEEARNLLDEQYDLLRDIKATWRDIYELQVTDMTDSELLNPKNFDSIGDTFIDMLNSTGRNMGLIMGQFQSTVISITTDIRNQMSQGLASETMKAFYNEYLNIANAMPDLATNLAYDANTDYSALAVQSSSYEEFLQNLALRASKMVGESIDVAAEGWKTNEELYEAWANSKGMGTGAASELSETASLIQSLMNGDSLNLNPDALFDSMNQFTKAAEAAGVKSEDIQKLLKYMTDLSDVTDQYSQNFTTVMETMQKSITNTEDHLEALGSLTTMQKYENTASLLAEAQALKIKAYEEGYLTEELENTINEYISDQQDAMIKLMRQYQSEVQSALTDNANEYKQSLEDEKTATEKYYDDLIEKLNRVNDAKKESVKLTELLTALENAQNEKKRVYREGVGWSYQVDREAVKKAEDNLEDYYLDQRISDLEASKKNELEALNDSIENWDDYIKALETAYDEANKIRQLDLIMAESGVNTRADLYNKMLNDQTNYINEFEKGNEKYLGYMRDFYEEVKTYLGLNGEIYGAQTDLANSLTINPTKIVSPYGVNQSTAQSTATTGPVVENYEKFTDVVKHWDWVSAGHQSKVGSDWIGNLTRGMQGDAVSALNNFFARYFNDTSLVGDTFTQATEDSLKNFMSINQEAVQSSPRYANDPTNVVAGDAWRMISEVEASWSDDWTTAITTATTAAISNSGTQVASSISGTAQAVATATDEITKASSEVYSKIADVGTFAAEQTGATMTNVLNNLSGINTEAAANLLSAYNQLDATHKAEIDTQMAQLSQMGYTNEELAVAFEQLVNSVSTAALSIQAAAKSLYNQQMGFDSGGNLSGGGLLPYTLEQAQATLDKYISGGAPPDEIAAAQARVDALTAAGPGSYQVGNTIYSADGSVASSGGFDNNGGNFSAGTRYWSNGVLYEVQPNGVGKQIDTTTGGDGGGGGGNNNAPSVQDQLDGYSQDWYTAQANGDQKGMDAAHDAANNLRVANGLDPYATGLEQGPVTYTGLAMLHGTPSAPEYVLNNDQAYRLLSTLGVDGKVPAYETNTPASSTNYTIAGDVVITNPTSPSSFWSELSQSISTRFSVTKENL